MKPQEGSRRYEALIGRTQGMVKMKAFFFYISLLLNGVALVLAFFWTRSQVGYEPWIAMIAIVTSSIGMLSAKSFWLPEATRSVTQIGNKAGGDIAGGNITKTS